MSTCIRRNVVVQVRYYPFIMLMLLICTHFSFAAPITWSTAQNTSGVDDLVAGYGAPFARNGSASDVTINSTTFTAYALGAGFAENAYGSTMISTGDTNFDTLIKSFTYGGGTSMTRTLTGLTPETPYEVQVFYNDQRSLYAGRVMTYGDGLGNNINLKASSTGGTSGDYGQFAVGSFIADSTTQNLVMITNGFSNAHVNAILVVSAVTVPLPTLMTASNPVSASFTVDVSFAEAITGLQESDFVVTNGSVTPGSLAGSGSSWSVEITPAANGDVSVILPANSVTDIDGDNNQNPSSNELITTYIMPGSDQPAVTLATASSYVAGPYTVDVVFDEPVTGLELGDFDVVNGSVSNLSGSGDTYSVLVTPVVEGDVSVTLPANRVTDTDGDGLMNAASNTLVAGYQIPDYPEVVLYGKLSTATPSSEVFLTFSEEITGLEDSDFIVTNGHATATGGSGRYYSTTITALAPGTVEVTLPAGAVLDVDGDNIANPVSNTLRIQCLSDFHDLWIVDDAASWTDATGATSNMNVSGGFVQPTANSSQFTSVIKTYPTPREAVSLTFKQSPVWDNWTAVPRVSPSAAGDALVFIPVANDDYYILGLSTGSVYHAWHSTNMVNWTHYGPVVSGAEGRWVTTAEYKDGEFYIYSDYKNDHTPWLFKDSNLKDGVPGTLEGIAFHNPGHGSDTSVIRNDEDGLFHMIYENWSPINARQNSWDSPLAGHTSSADGFTGFDPDEHQPPVDHRTNPTGVFATYSHPGTPEPCVYEIHEPAQDSYGDWTTIKIGSQFYLFSDYDALGAGIRTARFTSDSLYKEFDLVGAMGSGHPDPTVGFAEGQFYLISQNGNDHISPGPWVDGVEARAGVDIDGDEVIDQWTSWQSIFEQYNHTPNYVRVVTLTPAKLDLSSLSAGYGFQYEFRVDNTVVSGVSPIMDRVEMEFDQSTCNYYLEGDMDSDCDADLDDLITLLRTNWLVNCVPVCDADLQEIAILASNWLVDCNTDPTNLSCVPIQ